MKLVRFVLFAAAAPLFAGGFYLDLGSPSASKDPKAHGAVMIARLSGCHEAEKGALRATAEGIVNGKRHTIPLKTVALDAPGAYAITRQWPAEGKWVVVLSGTHPSFSTPTETAVPVEGDTYSRAGVRSDNQKALAGAVVEKMLQ